ncbi:HAD hydrolase-like protein [Actinotalea sp. K2]|uniref:HAD hydrolase-like protein n=1 Tax=Actinotalea sp. K2 TaxID=2939438 RepID=UPI002016D52D|nr:HAD hydrolase-like protein [Actinotalea sp. K2]MCL3861116.1 HAD hydrolase-like protein [Actinotalea sp. K2]
MADTAARGPRYDVALFDIDGTLCDPGTGITSAAQHALARLGIDEQDPAALRRFVGPPLEHSFRDYYALDAEQVTAAVRHYRESYQRQGLDQYRAYDGVASLLRRLRDAGVAVSVVTAKIQPFAEQALLSTGLRGLVDLVSGRAPDEVVTKDVTLAAALARLAVPRDRVVMIGDREHDVHAAQANDIDCIGVLYGYGTRDELLAAGATHTARTPDDVEHLVLGTAPGVH